MLCPVLAKFFYSVLLSPSSLIPSIFLNSAFFSWNSMSSNILLITVFVAYFSLALAITVLISFEVYMLCFISACLLRSGTCRSSRRWTSRRISWSPCRTRLVCCVSCASSFCSRTVWPPCRAPLDTWPTSPIWYFHHHKYVWLYSYIRNRIKSIVYWSDRALTHTPAQNRVLLNLIIVAWLYSYILILFVVTFHTSIVHMQYCTLMSTVTVTRIRRAMLVACGWERSPLATWGDRYAGEPRLALP